MAHTKSGCEYIFVYICMYVQVSSFFFFTKYMFYTYIFTFVHLLFMDAAALTFITGVVATAQLMYILNNGLQ